MEREDDAGNAAGDGAEVFRPTSKQIAAWYVEPGHPTAFSSPGAVYRYFGGRAPMRVVEAALSSVDAYTKHREARRPRVYNPFYAYRRRTRFQADLIDVARLKTANTGTAFLLVLIDVFTRKVWVTPLRTKSAPDMTAALGRWLAKLNETETPGEGEGVDVSRLRQRWLYTDRGLEFTNRAVRELLARHNVRSDFAQRGLNKAALAERVNKTLQIKIYKYLSHRGVARYLDALPALVGSYNNAKHRTLKFLTPNEADRPSNAVRVRTLHLERYAKRAEQARGPAARAARRLKKGQLVRIKVPPTSKVGRDRRAYTPYFTDELHGIVDVRRRQPIPMFQVRSLASGKVLAGRFYAAELTPTQVRAFKVKRVLRKRGEGTDDEQRLVRWEGLHPVFDCWVPTAAIRRAGWVDAHHLSLKPSLAHLPPLDGDGGAT